MSFLRVLALLGLAGCAAPARGVGAREVEVKTFVLGAFGRKNVDVRDICGDRRALSVRLHRSTFDYAVSVGTLGIYVPHRVRVVCEGDAP